MTKNNEIPAENIPDVREYDGPLDPERIDVQGFTIHGVGTVEQMSEGGRTLRIIEEWPEDAPEHPELANRLRKFAAGALAGFLGLPKADIEMMELVIGEAVQNAQRYSRGGPIEVDFALLESVPGIVNIVVSNDIPEVPVPKSYMDDGETDEDAARDEAFLRERGDPIADMQTHGRGSFLFAALTEGRSDVRVYPPDARGRILRNRIATQALMNFNREETPSRSADSTTKAA